MINGYYLATDRILGVIRIVHVYGDEILHLTLTGNVRKARVSEWKDFIGPITYDLFEGLIKDIKTLRNSGDFTNIEGNPFAPDGNVTASALVDELIKRISPTND